jgi:predicted TIM-barrel fold metal-dependent hydrolase
MVFGAPAPSWPLPSGISDRLGPLRDRVMFGSDLPTVSRSFANQISGLSALGLGDDWQRAVLWHNAASLLGLDAQPA